MRSIRKILAFGTGLLLSFNQLHAQSTQFSNINVSLEAATDMQTMLEALASTTPVSFDSLPKDKFNRVVGSAFWSFQNPNWPPLPANFYGVDVWPLGDGVYVIDDRTIDYAGLQAEADAEAALLAAASPMMRMMSSSFASSYAYGNPVYLTNMTASIAYDGSTTANFSIGGGTNFVPYDILTSTNLALPVPNWNWIGIGYTSNNYTFYEQPANLGFYMLAKPATTMTVGWGGDIYGQADVPLGTNHLLMVSGGYGYNLGILTNGTVIGWGNSSAAGWVLSNLVGNVSMVCAAWNHNVALLTNGTVVAWGINGAAFGWHLTEVPPDLTNATVISAQALHTLALRKDGTVAAWGYNYFGQTNVPAGLTNVTAIAAGGNHSLAVSNGYVVAWGNNNYGQCTVPAGLSNVVDVAASDYHSLALKADGTVKAWGDNNYGESTVPTGLSNVVAIVAGGSPNVSDAYMGSPLPYSLALKKDGQVSAWGAGILGQPVQGLNNVIGISGGLFHALAVRTGPPTPVITLEPVDQYQVTGGSVTFNARGQGLYGVAYQWQTNGVNLPGATNTALTLTNVQTAQAIAYAMMVTGLGGTGSIASSNASLTLVTPPVIVSQSPMPTNQVGIYQSNLTLSVTATAPGQSNGFPLHFQWQFNGTNIGANSNSYSFAVGNSGAYSVVVTNLAGSVTSLVWQVTMTYAGSIFENIMTRTNGRSGFIWSGFVYGRTNATGFTWLTNGFLTGLRGVSAISPANELGGSQVPGTALTRRHVYIRGHDAGGVANMISTNLGFIGKKYWFIGTNNVAVSATIADNRICDPSNGEDWTILFLSTDLPAEVEPMRCIMNGTWTATNAATPGNIWNKLPASPPWPIFGTCQHNQLSGSDWGYSIFDNHDIHIGGDSGSPNMLLLTNEVVFLSGRTTWGISSLMLSNLNAMTISAGLSTNNYQPQFVDLSGWPNL
jgi:hypothetical protein